MDIVGIVTLISSRVFSRSHVEVPASVRVKNPTSHKEHVGKWNMDPNNPVDNHHFMAAFVPFDLSLVIRLNDVPGN
jgi:hypothetical protein